MPLKEDVKPEELSSEEFCKVILPYATVSTANKSHLTTLPILSNFAFVFHDLDKYSDVHPLFFAFILTSES